MLRESTKQKSGASISSLFNLKLQSNVTLLTQAQCTFRSETLFLTTLTAPCNWFHLAYHAIPSSEFFHRISQEVRGGVTVLPMLLPFKDREVHFPLTDIDSSVQSWRPYNLLLWSLGPMYVRKFRADVAELLKSSCTCFPRSYGGHSEIEPSPKRGLRLKSPPPSVLAPRFQNFQSRVALNMGTANLTLENRVLLVLRNGTRKFLNEEETIAEVDKALSSTSFFCQPVRFEKMSLEEQMQLVMTSRMLIGYHGQGLAWTSMLRTALKPCATIELFAAGLTLPGDYRDFSAANNVNYFRSPHRKYFKECRDLRACGDIWVDTKLLVAVLDRALSAIYIVP